MRYSPCGMGCDFIKYPYEAPCRFVDDPAAPTGVVRWTPILPGAEMLPFPSVIHNLVMDPEPWRWDLPVGEQWNGFGRRATWVTTPPAITGQKFCGRPAWFMDGEDLDTTPPLAVYGANKWLLCCAQAPVAYGGAGAGGNPIPNVVPAIKVYGGAGGNGTPHPRVLPPGLSGGGKGGGGPLAFQIRPVGVPAGGAKGGGVLPFQLTPAGAPAGGGRSGGVLAFQLTPAGAPAGGGRSGGVLAFQLTPGAGTSGGGRGGGTVAYHLQPASGLSGGGKGGGTLQLRLSATGGVQGGGKGGGTLAHNVSGGGGISGVTSASQFAAPGTFTTPAGASAGNVLVLLAFDTQSRGIVIASPWVLQAVWGPGTNFGGTNVYTYEKLAAGGAESVSIGLSSGSANIGVICVAVAKASWDTFNNGGSQGTVSSTSITAGAVTPATTTDVGLGCYCIDGLRTITLPHGLTFAASVQGTDSGASATLSIGTVQLSSSSSWNPGTATANVADFNDSLTVVVK